LENVQALLRTGEKELCFTFASSIKGFFFGGKGGGMEEYLQISCLEESGSASKSVSLKAADLSDKFSTAPLLVRFRMYSTVIV
jgi:hypothetical protein